MEFQKCYPQGRRKALTLSYDDGVWPDRKLIRLMKEHRVLGTFNLNSLRRPVPGRIDGQGQQDFRMEPEEIGNLYDGFEVAAHSCTHPLLETLPEKEVYRELFLDKKNLEERYHQKILGLALPYGTHNDTVDRIIKELGFLYCRTIVSTYGFGVPEHLPMLDPTCRHRDPRLMELLEDFLGTDQELALFYLWGHSFEFELNHNWEIVEAFLDRAAGREEIWYATNGQIITYLQAMNQLIIGEDYLINPTDQELWVRLRGEVTSIPGNSWKDISRS